MTGRFLNWVNIGFSRIELHRIRQYHEICKWFHILSSFTLLKYFQYGGMFPVRSVWVIFASAPEDIFQGEQIGYLDAT
jgi:hypothetical protein